MDKTQHINRRVKSKQGFALLITLSVLSVVIALTMVLLSYFEKVQQDATTSKALIQADVYYADITNIFKGFKNKKTLFSVLYASALPLQTEDGRFSLFLHCSPLSKGVNVNWLGLDQDPKKEALHRTAVELFEMLADEYKIEDLGRLLEMLYEDIGTKKGFVLKENSRLHQKNGIISYTQFMRIISAYQFEVDDRYVTKVPWEKYISFSLHSEKIEVEYSSGELIAFLFDIDLSVSKSWAAPTGNQNISEEKVNLETFINDNGGDYNSRKSIVAGKNFLNQAVCEVSYMLSEERYRFKFEYIEGEAKYFEFYGKQ